MKTSKNWNIEALKSAPQLLFNCNFDCNCNNVLQRKNQRFLPTDVSMVTRYYNQTIKKTLIKQRRYFFFSKKICCKFFGQVENDLNVPELCFSLSFKWPFLWSFLNNEVENGIYISKVFLGENVFDTVTVHSRWFLICLPWPFWVTWHK